MSEIDKATKRLNDAADKATITTDFFDELTTAGKRSDVTNPNNNKTVPSVSKKVMQVYEEEGLNPDAISRQNQQLIRSLGEWQSGLTFEKKGDYATFNDQAIITNDDTPLPYTTQGSDPTDGPDEGLVIPFAEVTRSDVVLNVASISELINVQPTGDGFKVNVTAYYDGWVPADGAPKGGGVFVWDSSRAKSDHNGGTVISPTVPAISNQPGATLNERHYNFLDGAGESDLSGTGVFVAIVGVSVSPSQFGAMSIDVPGFSSFYSCKALQACENWVASNASQAQGSGVGSASVFKIALEKGVYLIGSTIKTGSYCHYDFSRAVLYEPTETIPIIDTVGYRTTFKNIIFDGGLHHVRVVGPNVDTMINILDGCEHRSVGDVCVFHDLSVNHGENSANPRHGFSMHQLVTNFKTYQSSFIRSASDGTTLDGGWAQFRPYRTGDSGVDEFWAESLMGPLVAKNILGVSVNDNPSSGSVSFWFKSGDLSYTTSESELQIDRFRCGEGGSAIIKADNSKRVVITNSPIFGRPGNTYAWMEIHNRIPSITVKNCEGFVDSLGVLIDSSTIPDVPAYLSGVRKYELNIDINDNSDKGFRSSAIVHSVRADYLSSGLSTPQINSMFTTFIDNECVAEYMPRGRNYFTSNVYSFSQGSFVNATVSSNTAIGSDDSTGYNLEVRQSTADGAIYGRTMIDWGSSLDAGVYNYSVLLRSDKPVNLVLIYNDVQIEIIRVPASSEYKRYYASFYHTGNASPLTMQLETIPSGTVFSVGLPQVSKGKIPSVYQMAGNDFNNYVPSVTYGTAPPSDGVHKRGDVVKNINPVAGGVAGWICVSGDSTSVGTWKSYGAIEA